MSALLQNQALWNTAPWAGAFAVLFWCTPNICRQVAEIIKQTRLLVREWKKK
jgi:hypothetical protein